ncbi:hypothetical protein WN51_09277 [Melipona quadrifasciata]|uniref:Uncharacterized protein n=1 Tax=Melipona quadrifasciata TaxID=166423 RepID=A0A0N0BIG1_9HYME|nr:hypothetical protein WN51_09277 [Melipona quadrifasciata]
MRRKVKTASSSFEGIVKEQLRGLVLKQAIIRRRDVRIIRIEQRDGATVFSVSSSASLHTCNKIFISEQQPYIGFYSYRNKKTNSTCTKKDNTEYSNHHVYDFENKPQSIKK